MPEKLTAIEEEMRKSYMDYAMSVIVGRSLPDVRDGLKPVQRRILYSMYELNLTHDKPYKKCARIVGEVMGKYHPHGDMAVYDALVHLAQSFSLRYPLIEGQGNFGSMDGDSAAAMRYTEAKLERLAEEMLEDIEKETVETALNFDGSLKEPVLLPSKIPNLLINGTSGIAVGMATKMPPHNISEIMDALSYYIDHQDCNIEDLLEFVKGPDFPTGGTAIGYSSMISSYYTGRGSFKIRANYKIEKHDGFKNIVFTEIPYEVNKSELLKKIGELAKEGKLFGIMGLRDESDKEGIRIIIKIKKDENIDFVLNQLFEHTPLETSYNVINLTLVDNVPKILNLKELISEFVKFRITIITKRAIFELNRAKEREHIVLGLLKALDHIDEIITLIRNSNDVETAKKGLVEKFDFSELQSKAILDMRLQKLTGLERENLKNEEMELNKKIQNLSDLLQNDSLKYKLMREEFNAVKKKYGDSRKTIISEEEIKKRELEELIPSENVIITVTNAGYIKRMPVSEYRIQRRGGTGLLTESPEEDFIKNVFVANTHDYILFFTNKGRVYALKAYNIPQTSRKAKGKAIVNFLSKLEPDEKVRNTVWISKFGERYVVFVTRRGIVKKTKLTAFKNIRSNGIIAIKLLDNDEVVSIKITDGNSDILIGTKRGMVSRFSEKQLRSLGRNSIGVRGIRLRAEDEVVGAALSTEGTQIFTITAKGKGKRSDLNLFRLIRRGGIGVIGHKITEETGEMIELLGTVNEDSIMLISKNGATIQFELNRVSVLSRATSGVKLIDLKENDYITAATKLPLNGAP